MSLILMTGEALVFVAIGALIVSPYPFWPLAIVLIGFGVALAIARDTAIGREAVDDYRESEALRRRMMGDWR